jgi:hypothetical protein
VSPTYWWTGGSADVSTRTAKKKRAATWIDFNEDGHIIGNNFPGVFTYGNIFPKRTELFPGEWVARVFRQYLKIR